VRAYQIDPGGVIQGRMTKTISDLSMVQVFREQPFEAFQNFQEIYSAEKIQDFFKTIRLRFVRRYQVEFEYRFAMINRTQTRLRMPEQEFIGKRALVLTISFLGPWLTVE
jgi:hypothetical protein